MLPRLLLLSPFPLGSSSGHFKTAKINGMVGAVIEEQGGVLRHHICSTQPYSEAG